MLNRLTTFRLVWLFFVVVIGVAIWVDNLNIWLALVGLALATIFQSWYYHRYVKPELGLPPQ